MFPRQASSASAPPVTGSLLLLLKRAVASRLCSAPVGRAIALLFCNRIPHRGCSIDTRGRGVRNSTKAALFWGIYESAETRFLHRYLEPERDVIELGGSLGVVTSHVARRIAPGRQIVCVEANPGLIASIAANVRRNCAGARLTVIHGAIFYAPEGTETPTSIDLEVGATNVDFSIGGSPSEKSVAVPVISLSEILERHCIGNYALVCDIEGAEIGLIECETESLARCQQLIIELHPTYWNNRLWREDELCQRLQSEHGFQLRERHGPVCVFGR